MPAALLPDGLWELIEPFIPTDRGEDQGRQAALGRPGMSYWHHIRLAQWDSLGDATARNGLWIWNELLAANARLAGARHLAVDPLHFAGLARSLQEIDWSRAIVDGSSVRAVFGGFKQVPTLRPSEARQQASCDLRWTRIPLAINSLGPIATTPSKRSR